MPNYKVMTDRCALGKQGATISGDDLEGFNLDALVEGGHLAEVNVKIGDVVEPKDIIGEVMLNMEDNTSKLHFEVWKQQVFQNPLPWLKAK